jgi:hypothetical protein
VTRSKRYSEISRQFSALRTSSVPLSNTIPNSSSSSTFKSAQSSLQTRPFSQNLKTSQTSNNHQQPSTTKDPQNLPRNYPTMPLKTTTESPSAVATWLKSTSTPTKPSFLVVYASLTNGRSWCGDCREAESYINSKFASGEEEIKVVYAGQRDE